MGALTPDGQIWYPGLSDTGEPNVLLAALASSLENGIVPRIKTLESFIGVNLGLVSPVLTDAVIGYYPFTVADANRNFIEGMTVNSGIVTVPFSGMYQINFNANFQPTTSVAPRINTYIYKNSASIAFSSAYGEANTSRYTNCSIGGIYKLAEGDTVDVRATSLDANSNLASGSGSSFSMTLVSRS